MPVVTSGIFRSAGTQSFKNAHRDRVCVHVFIEVSIRACCERSTIWEGYLDKTLLSTINFYLVDYVQLIYFDLKNKNGSLKKSIYLHELDI